MKNQDILLQCQHDKSKSSNRPAGTTARCIISFPWPGTPAWIANFAGSSGEPAEAGQRTFRIAEHTRLIQLQGAWLHADYIVISTDDPAKRPQRIPQEPPSLPRGGSAAAAAIGRPGHGERGSGTRAWKVLSERGTVKNFLKKN